MDGLHQFLRTWRRELRRGAFLFGTVLVVGVGVVFAGRSFAGEWPAAFLLHGRGGHEWTESLHWEGLLQPGERVYLRNMNGPMVVLPADGDSVVVTAEQRSHHADQDLAEIATVPHAGGVTFCAVRAGGEEGCGAEGDFRTRHAREGVTVRFTVYVPHGVGVDLATVNGAVDVDGVTGAVTARTVNGRVRAIVRRAPFRAETVNGSIDATFEALEPGLRGDVALETVNGSITANLEGGVNARVEASTVHGRVETDVPLVVSGGMSSRKLAGQIGTGGPRVTLRTVNGSVHLNDVSSLAEPPDPPQ